MTCEHDTECGQTRDTDACRQETFKNELKTPEVTVRKSENELRPRMLVRDLTGFVYFTGLEMVLHS